MLPLHLPHDCLPAAPPNLCASNHLHPPPTPPPPSRPHPSLPQAFEEMRSRPCAPDSIVYAAIMDALWETGVAWAQRRAAQIFRQASQVQWGGGVCEEGGGGCPDAWM